MSRISGRGPIPADILFLSSAPGYHELSAGYAFAGPAGHELDKMISVAGLGAYRCRLDNVCQEPLASDGERAGYDYTSWYANLIERIKEVNPRVIVPLGDPALHATTGRTGIMKWRGSILESTILPGVKVIGTIDPAFLLRGQWPLRRPTIWDLERVAQEVKTSDIKLPQWNFEIRPSEEQVKRAFDRLSRANYIVFDIEGTGKISCIGLGDATDWAICIPFERSDGTLYWSEEQEPWIWRGIAELLQGPIPKVAQNLPFDWINLRLYGIEPRNCVWDTMKMHNSVWAELPHSLAFMTSVYTRQPFYKDEGKSWEAGVSEDRFWTYNCTDVGVTGEVFHALKKEMDDLRVTEHHIRHYVLPFRIWVDAELDGLSVHKGRQDKHRKKTDAELAVLEPKLMEKVGRELNVRSQKQMIEFIEQDLKLKVPFNRKTRGKTVNEDALNKILIGHDSELLKLILDIRGARTLKSTFLSPKLASDGRMHCHFGHTESQRMKSSKSILGSGSNLQNQPKTVRDMYVVDDPAFLFVEYDLSQAEDRWVAWSAPVPKKQELYLAGKKVHTYFASVISEAYTGTHLEYEQIPQDNTPKSLYYTGKKTVYGSNYDMGPDKFALIILQPMPVAKVLQEIYHRTFPEISQVWWVRIQEQLKKNRTTRNPDGSARIFLDQFGPELYREAYANEPQEGVCYHMNQSLVTLYYAHKEALDSKTAFDDFLMNEAIDLKDQTSDIYLALRESQLKIKLQVHDSGLYQAVASTIPYCAKLVDVAVNRPITGLIGGPFIIPAEHTVGPAWGVQRRMHLKNIHKDVEMCERVSKTFQMAIRRNKCSQKSKSGVSGVESEKRNLVGFGLVRAAEDMENSI